MAEASIPVDLFNPGQVFACLGFLEAAEVLLGDAEGGFDWNGGPEAGFRLRASGNESPFRAVLQFLATAELQRVAPGSYADPLPSKKTQKGKVDDNETEDVAADDAANDGPLVIQEQFPGSQPDWRALPVRLARDGHHLNIGHWCDTSSREDFKLFAGQQRGPAIAKAMLKGVAELWAGQETALLSDPLGKTMPLGGSSFKFDARKSWTAIDAGYSPDEQKHLVAASPAVELLAAAGLEHARPSRFGIRQVRYGAWNCLLPPPLARPALAGADIGIRVKTFRFTFALAGKNKVVTTAEEETNS